MPSNSHTLPMTLSASPLARKVKTLLGHHRVRFAPTGLLRLVSLRTDHPLTGAFEERIAGAKSRVAGFTPLEAVELVGESDARLVDVREHKEFARLRIRGALHLKRSTLEAAISHYFPNRNARLICYCNDGTWSALAADTLHSMGYTHAGFVIGGLRHWIREELPVLRQEVFDE